MIRKYLELAKPRITMLVAATSAVGYWAAGGRDWNALAWLCAGTALASAAAGCLNQILEVDPDARMRRTQSRPLPAGKIKIGRAVFFGVFCGIAGLSILAFFNNSLASILALLTIVLYAAFYTPLKKVSPLSTWIGAAAGAMPPLIGWAAAAGTLESGAWALFAIQFLWQIPHFLALFWMYREDYGRAGFRMMPVVDGTGKATACQIAIHSFAILPASLMPNFLGMTGTGYAAGAFLASSAFMGLGMKASWTLEARDTRRLFLASLIYLPVVFSMLMLSV